MLQWLKNFIVNMFDNPRTSITGIATLAGAGVAAYGMATGHVPVTTETVTGAVSSAAAGVGLLAASDPSKTGQDIAAGAAKVQSAAQQVAPTVDAISTAYAQLKANAETGQKHIDAYQQASLLISSMAAAMPTPDQTKTAAN